MSVDFTAMYGYCQQLEMPTTPGLKWEKQPHSKVYRKNVMTDSHSFECQQWLEWRQVSDDFLLNKSGQRSQIEMKYYRGEKKIYNSKTKDFSWPVDGYAESDNGVKIYEFLGEYWHDACPECGSGDEDEIWARKKSDILRMGYKLEFIWGCKWRKMKESLKNIETPRFPNILKMNETEADILDGIKSGRLFGYLFCDISSPDHVVEKWKNFPLIIKRQIIDESLVSDIMNTQIKSEYGSSSNFKRTTLIQCFNDTEHLLFSPLARFYLNEGVKLSNIKFFIQYHPDFCLKPFIDLVTKMRIESEYEKKPLKGQTAKIIGNSGYGARVNNFRNI